MTTTVAIKDVDAVRDELTPLTTLRINIRAILESVSGKLTDDEIDQWFVSMAEDNEGRGFYLELTNEGELVINPMVYMDSGFAEAEGIADLLIWAREHGGRVPSSRTILRLPDGSRAEPDLSWVSPEQLEVLLPLGLGRAIDLCPVFVGEIMSGTDRLSPLQRKMERYIANGALLGWLIDPYRRQVHVYRPDVEPEVLEDPEEVSGEPELPGFVFEVRRRIFDLRTIAE